jgi:hypothetical protein
VRPDTAAPDYDDKGLSELVEAFGPQEGAVTGKLLEDQLVVEITPLRALGKKLVVLVLLVGLREGALGVELRNGRHRCARLGDGSFQARKALALLDALVAENGGNGNPRGHCSSGCQLELGV